MKKENKNILLFPPQMDFQVIYLKSFFSAEKEKYLKILLDIRFFIACLIFKMSWA